MASQNVDPIDLGPRLKQYTCSPLWIVAFGFTSVVSGLFSVMCFITAITGFGGDETMGWVWGSVFAFFALFCAVALLVKLRTKASLHQHGISFSSLSGSHEVPWNECQSIYERIVKERFRAYTLLTEGGKRIKLDLSQFQNLEELAATIKQRTFDQRLRDVLVTFDKGESTPFGPLVVDKTSVKGKGRSFQWDELAYYHFSLLEGTLRLVKEDHDAISVKLAKIPNLDVFMHLLIEHSDAEKT